PDGRVAHWSQSPSRQLAKPDVLADQEVEMTKHVLVLLAAAACGGGGTKAAEKPAAPAEPAVAAAPAEPAPAPEPAKPPAPPPPKVLHAKAALDPVKAAKLKGASITFTQEEGKPATVASSGWFDGIKAGKYHLVVHASKECGPNATKAGKAMSVE